MVRLLTLVCFTTIFACAQSADAFEAAVIKPLKTFGPFHFNVLPNRLDVENLSLRYLIKQAFDVADFQLSGPDSALDNSFTIQATSGAPVSRAVMMAMLRNLLIERFHLATHWVTRTQDVYRLTLGPRGEKMEQSETGYAGANSPARIAGGFELNGPMSMRQLSERLTRFAGKPVIDATGLDGYFTIRLHFSVPGDDIPEVAVGLPPALRDAVQEQLGLKLVPSKEPVKFLIVDHADKTPAES